MDKVNICNCPYMSWCESGRQRLQEFFRQEGDKEECLFIPLIKQLIEKENRFNKTRISLLKY